MAIHRKDNLKAEITGSGMQVTNLSGPERGDKMITVKEIFLAPGAEVPVHKHPDSEETHFLVEGELVAVLGDCQFKITSRDCMIAPKGVPHGMKNTSGGVARIIVMFPKINPLREAVENHTVTEKKPNTNVSFRSEMKSFEFAPGINRFDMVGDFLGAESSYFSELTFDSGTSAPNHYHPHHEESMFCLEGKLNAVYAEENNIELNAGDMFTCEPKIRHGVNNPFDGKGTLLAIHCVLNPPPRVECD